LPIHIEVITPERKVYEDDVDMVIAPGSEGYLGILPHHAPLLTGLGAGEFRVKKGGVEQALAEATAPVPLAVLRRSCRMRTASLCAVLATLTTSGRIRKTSAGYQLAR